MTASFESKKAAYNVRVLAALSTNGGKYIDLHGKLGTVRTITHVGFFGDHIVPLFENTQFCLNPITLNTNGFPQLETGSVGGNLDTTNLGGIVAAVNVYNKDQQSSPFGGSLITKVVNVVTGEVNDITHSRLDVKETSEMTPYDLFTMLFDATIETIPFKEEFNNGTGYFDPVTLYDNFEGNSVKFTTPNGRKAILLRTASMDNVVVFMRYRDAKTIVCNATKQFEKTHQDTLDLSGPLSFATIVELFAVVAKEKESSKA